MCQSSTAAFARVWLITSIKRSWVYFDSSLSLISSKATPPVSCSASASRAGSISGYMVATESSRLIRRMELIWSLSSTISRLKTVSLSEMPQV